MHVQTIRSILAEVGPRGPGRRYPAGVRLAVARWVSRRCSEGASLQAAADEVGIPVGTAQRWLAGETVAVGTAVLIPPPPAQIPACAAK